MWIILIIFIFLLSIFISFNVHFKCYSINIKSLFYNDKSSLFLSLATKIGVGSVIGTVSSIIIGGYSSIIWMIIFTCFMIPIIYAESRLGYIYKQRVNNSFIGGPHFIIKNKVISIVSLIVIIILYSFLFQMIQVNTISNILHYTLNINKISIVIFISVIIILIITLNNTEVTNIINRVVPFKCILFIIVCLYGIITHIDKLYLNIDIFNIKSIITGFVIGIKRSIFMNEVLIGTTSISSGSSSLDIKTETSYQIIGVLFISIVITLLITCLVIIYNNCNILIDDYNLLIVNIFRYTNGSIGVLLIVIILILFAITTILSGYYILDSNIKYFIHNKLTLFFY